MVLLLTDNQLTKEVGGRCSQLGARPRVTLNSSTGSCPPSNLLQTFLVYINDLLANGDVPDLCAAEDRDNFVNAVSALRERV